MTESASPSDRRAQHVALFGLCLQTALCGGLIGLAFWFQSDAVAAVARLMGVSLPIWAILYLLFKQMRRVGTEALETAELKRSQAAAAGEALFELDDEALLLEQNRLRWMVKWMLPAVTVICAAYLLLGNFVGWNWSFNTAFQPDDAGGVMATRQPMLVVWFVVAAGLCSFLTAFYAIGLAKAPQWRIIRAGATAMAGNALMCLILAIALAGADNIEWAEPLCAYLVRGVLFILGIEFAMNFILDLYRPRVPGEIARPSFDSRLLGLITEPGGVAKSIADAANYQFGFEVSKTWFYQLLQRWLLPIVAVAMVVILTLTSVVIVDADEQVVIERFGKRLQTEGDALEPGISLKWPFPIDIVRRAPVRRVDELVIGEASNTETHAGKAITWTEQHDYIPELMLLVASSKEGDIEYQTDAPSANIAGSESSPVSLLMMSLPIEYRIKDVHAYLYNYDDPVKLLEAISYQYLSDHAASVDIDELMGPGRETFNTELRQLIQRRLDELEVGIEIVFVGLRGAHPPAKDKVAEAFQSVIRAEIAKSVLVSAAEGQARRTLIEVAGTQVRAKDLDEAIVRRNALRDDPEADPARLAEAEQEVEDLLMGNPVKGVAPLSGMAAAVLADARARASYSKSNAVMKVHTFGAAVAAYETAPDLFKRRKLLQVYENLGFVRRYLIAGDPSKVNIVYETRREGALDQVLAEGLEKEQSKD